MFVVFWRVASRVGFSSAEPRLLSPSDPAQPLNAFNLDLQTHALSIDPTSIIPPQRIKCKGIRLISAAATDHR
jgi:hypothetical protein